MANFIWEDEASRYWEINDGENGPVLFRFTRVKTWPVVYWYGSGKYRRYFFG